MATARTIDSAQSQSVTSQCSQFSRKFVRGLPYVPAALSAQQKEMLSDNNLIIIRQALTRVSPIFHQT